MTDQQYESCKSNNIKIYQIWIKGGRFHKELCDYKQFDNSWIEREWINKSIPYNMVLQSDIMYATEDKLEHCKKRLITSLKKDQLRIIKEAQKKLESLEKIERNMEK